MRRIFQKTKSRVVKISDTERRHADFTFLKNDLDNLIQFYNYRIMVTVPLMGSTPPFKVIT
jgi:hypothetical protein